MPSSLTKASPVLLTAILLISSCGGGSSSGTQPPPPHNVTFTTVDATGAGTAVSQGTSANDINPSGVVAGAFSDSNYTIHAFVRDASGSITVFDAPGAGTANTEGTFSRAINSSGEIAGNFYNAQGLEHSFFRTSDGTLTVFDPVFGAGSGAQSINDGGSVAGGYVDGNGAHGYVRAPDGTFTTFDPTGNPSEVELVVSHRINASGAVAGAYTDTAGVFHGFVRGSDGTIQPLDAPGAGTAFNQGTEILDMNSSGVLVGGIAVGVVNGIDTTHSVVRSSDGTYTVFDPPQAGSHSSIAKAISDSGVVVGEYRDSNLVRHGYLLQPDGTFTSFDDPNAVQLPLSSIAIGTIPTRISVSGAVVGLYSDATGAQHGFIMQ